MKFAYCMLFLLLFSQITYAGVVSQEDVDNKDCIYLENVKSEYQVQTNQNFSLKQDMADMDRIKKEAKNSDFYVKNNGSYDINDQYKAKSTSYKSEKNFKKVTVGVQSNSSFTSDQLKQKNTIYSTYDLNKKMSVKGSYTTNSVNGTGNQLQGTMAITPQYKINDKFSINNTYSTNLSDNSNKEEVSLKYNPFKDNRMDFDVGAGQVQYSNGSPSSSQVNVEANFRF